ncbi:VQ motif-containing protein 17 [Rhododendron vialii]|uniref:VQ motif-containing protein 17 n=1 Tax=Rhododendron vialii TaxID=182163 RepID=UPI00265F1DDE|nr:VQ motif-containing protein 17 [Rhododendron vialii]
MHGLKNMKQHPSSNYVSTESKRGMNRDSQVISKVKPKPRMPRITHIFAPEVIKTDEASFRDLVQKLTGKPSGSETRHENTNSPPTIEQRSKYIRTENDVHIRYGERIKEESEEIFGGEDSNSFVDLIELPLLPLKSSHFSRYNGMPLFK